MSEPNDAATAKTPSKTTLASFLPLAAWVGVLFALLLPLVALNRRIEPDTGDRPIRLAPWFESLETYAMVLLVASIAVVIVLARRGHQSVTRIVVTTLVQSSLVFFGALPALYLSRGGGVLGDDYKRSHAGPRGQSAHVYSTGFLDSCRFAVYLAEGWSLSMRRVAVTRSCTEPTIRWDDEGKLVVTSR